MKEPFNITTDESDDLKFISIVNRLITEVSRTKKFEIVTISKVKNWFDHKWLNYSGKEVILFESDNLINENLALEPKWKEQITMPPFNPNRILSSITYPFDRKINRVDIKPIHQYQISQLNLQNRIELKSGNLLFAWFSSNSKINGRGSMMIYELKDKAVSTWYCQIEKRVGWEIAKSKNISREAINEMIK